MGYKIPRPDYTRPPDDFNVAADIGKAIASGISQYGIYRRQQQVEAQKLAQAEMEFKNTLFINQAKTLATFDKTAAKNFGQESEMFKQFQGIVREKAKNAMAASVAMQFDKNLSDEQRAEYAQVVADFDTYTASSMEQLGGVIADYNAFADKTTMKDQIVVGNPVNGERFFNQVTLTNLGGFGPQQYNLNAENFTRTVEAIGTNNIITSQVKLPKNHPTVVKNKQWIERGLAEGGKYNYGTLKEEDGMYVFTSKINAGAYATKEGFDFVQQVMPIMDGTQVMRDLNFLDKDNNVTEGNFYDKIYEVSTELKDIGKTEKTKTKIVDIHSFATGDGFQDSLSSEYAAIFESSQSMTQQIGYLEKRLGIVSLPEGYDKYKNLEDFLTNGSEEEKQKFFKLGLQKQLFEYSFKPIIPGQGTKAFDQPGLRTVKATGDFLTFLNKNTYLNEFGEPYTEGDDVYVIQDTKLYPTPESTSTSKGTKEQIMFGKIYSALEKGDLSGFSATQTTPGGETKYKYFKAEGNNLAGVYEVDDDGEKTGKEPEDIEILKSVYSIGTK